ncbi:Importin-9 [Myotis brandtii]|uniref:Importin-9 n=1 Tax=Myotis brandtii TaxID=109478 RepID=S7QAD2_MYOBR|nr:Importin-9 [Myotis brandtii]
MQVVSQLLDPRTSEFTAAFVGRLVSTLITKAGRELGENLDQILRAILSKMQQAETLSVMQSLIMVFAHLVHTQLEPLLEFLCSLPGPTGKPALEFVMAEWTSRQHLFYGQYEGKVRWASPGAAPGLRVCSAPPVPDVPMPASTLATVGGASSVASGPGGSPTRALLSRQSLGRGARLRGWPRAVAEASRVPCSSVALCKLLQHGINTDDKRLQDIRVKGEEIYSVDEGVRTRAKAAKSG